MKRVDIAKRDGGTRPLGIPTVSDRIAQAVVKAYLEPELEQHFHPDSYGYRPGKSALDAVGLARKRCWRYAWVLDLDIRAYFDTIPHDLLLKAVRRHTDCAWVLLYIERWLIAPVQLGDGTLQPPEQGTPQGSVISPLLANLFLHYVFDRWMARSHPNIAFERYADDILCHCCSEAQARWLKRVLEVRFAACGLAVHPQKTKIVYCKDVTRSDDFPVIAFDFLGFQFRARKTMWGKGEKRVFTHSFQPAVSPGALKSISRKVKRWRLHIRSDISLDELAKVANPQVRGWLNYFSNFYRTELRPTLKRIDDYLIRWARRKFKRLRRKTKGSRDWFDRLRRATPMLFAHWRLCYGNGRTSGAV